MEYIYNNLWLSFIYWLFLIINIWIVISDIKHRKIKNNLLLFLGLMLPIWYMWTELIIDNWIIAKFILASVILSLGIMAYNNQKNMLGSGDIKYLSILLLFLGSTSLSYFIWNIAILTFITLIWLVMYMVLVIVRCRDLIEKHIQQIFLEKFPLSSIKNHILSSIFDWLIIGFMLTIAIKDILRYLFQSIPTSWDIYFIVFLIIFLIRPYIKSIITNPKYRVISSMGIFMYISTYINMYWLNGAFEEYILFIKNIWYYIAIYIIIGWLSQIVFIMYDGVIKTKFNNTHSLTIPYSILIFGSFCITYFMNISLIWFIKNLF